VVSGLKQKSGADFDRAYLAHEVENHRAVIKVVRETPRSITILDAAKLRGWKA
jgi:predicted outer membrane protein